MCALLAVHRCAQSTVDSKPLRSTWIRFQATYAYTRQLTQRVHSSSVQALKWQTLAVTQTSWQRAVGEASLANLKPRRRRGAPGGVTAVQVAPRLAVHTQAVQHASAHRRYESRNSDAVTHAVPAALNNRFTGARMRARSSGFVLMNAGTHAHSCAGHQPREKGIASMTHTDSQCRGRTRNQHPQLHTRKPHKDGTYDDGADPRSDHANERQLDIHDVQVVKNGQVRLRVTRSSTPPSVGCRRG